MGATGPILVLTQPFDPTADYVVEELNRRGVELVRFDPGDFPQRLTLAAQIRDGWTGTLRTAERSLRLDQVGCVYYRRPSRFDLPAETAEPAWAAAEARMGLGGVLLTLPRWLNHPADIGRAEYKPAQLAAARAVGLRVPDTMITNDPSEATRFAAGRDVIYKPLTTARLSGSRMAYTTAVAADMLGDSIQHTAHLLQERLSKAYEVRATYVDGTIHAARIDALSPAAEMDWRADPANITYTPTELDADTVAGVHRLMQVLRLRFGALDLVITLDGQVWFLEVNPNGQWAFIEDATGLPITASIADALQKHSEM